MDLNWVALLIAFVGGSLMATVISAFAKYCLFHPVISVRLDEKRGSYGAMEVLYLDPQQKPTGASFQARYLRLHVENTGFSSIKDCSGYITKITKHIPGTQSVSEQEVVVLAWAHKDTEARDIPRGAFFHLDVASLYLLPTGRVLQVAHRTPTSLAPLFSGGKATYEFEILIAADNARPRRVRVKFDYDPQSDELNERRLEPVNKPRYPWWSCWRWLRSRQEWGRAAPRL
jgi:hypothetical protein